MVPSLRLTISASDDTDTTHPSLNSCFTSVRVSHLANLVKEKLPHGLKHVDAAHLVICRAGTPLDALNDDACLKSWDCVPASSAPEPLIVMAPSATVPQLGKCL